MTFKSKLLMTALVTAPLLAAQVAQADPVIIGLSPNGDATTKKAEAITAIKLAVQSTDLGETSYFVNALTGKSIAAFRVPDKKTYASDKAKISVNRREIGKLMGFAKNADSNARAGAMDVFGTMRTLVKNYDMDKIDAIVFMGDPLFDSPKEPSLSMRGGHVFSPAHIKASPARTHFGMAGLEGAFKNKPVHITTEGYDWVQSTRHQEAVERVLSLTVKHLGGNLVSFNADRALTVERVKDGIQTPVQTYEFPPSTKLEMEFVGFDDRDAVPIHERDISTETLTAHDITRARNVEVGITWSCACDIDIYVRPSKSADVLYYGHQRSREGKFYKDYRDARDLLNGLETASFNAPVNLHEMDIGINFYEGKAPANVTGQIRLALGSRTYAKPFTIKAQSGNQGKGSKKAFQTLKAPNSHWAMLRGSDIVKDYVKGGG